jgi:hypothetical protein
MTARHLPQGGEGCATVDPTLISVKAQTATNSRDGAGVGIYWIVLVIGGDKGGHGTRITLICHETRITQISTIAHRE